MAIAAILFSVLYLALPSQGYYNPQIPRVALDEGNSLLRLTATPSAVTPGEVTLTCKFDLDYANGMRTGDYKEEKTTLTSMVIASGAVCCYEPKSDIAGVTLATGNQVLIQKNMTSYVTSARGKIQQGRYTEISVTLDTTQMDVLGLVNHHCCQGNFLNNFGDFHQLNTHVDIPKIRENGPFLQASPSTVPQDLTEPLTLECTIHNTVADLGTLTSLVITKKTIYHEDQAGVYSDIAGVSMISPDRIHIREASRAFVSGEGRLNGDQSYLTIQIDPTSTAFRSTGYVAHGTYLCKAMFISGIGHVTNKVSEVTVYTGLHGHSNVHWG